MQQNIYKVTVLCLFLTLLISFTSCSSIHKIDAVEFSEKYNEISRKMLILNKYEFPGIILIGKRFDRVYIHQSEVRLIPSIFGYISYKDTIFMSKFSELSVNLQEKIKKENKKNSLQESLSGDASRP